MPSNKDFGRHLRGAEKASGVLRTETSRRAPLVAGRSPMGGWRSWPSGVQHTDGCRPHRTALISVMRRGRTWAGFQAFRVPGRFPQTLQHRRRTRRAVWAVRSPGPRRGASLEERADNHPWPASYTILPPVLSRGSGPSRASSLCQQRGRLRTAYRLRAINGT